MENSKFLFLLILISFLTPALAAPYNCPVSFCGSSANAVWFPFRMVGQQPYICGYQGFDLRCDRQGTMLLNLPNSGEFAVRSIDYRSQVIQVYDPTGCSAARLLTLDLMGSPFTASPIRNYTLLSCPVEIMMNRVIDVPCLTNSTYSTLATSSEFFAMAMNVIPCRIIGSLHGLVPRNQDQEGITSELNMDISLTWDSPNCKDCAANGGTCGYANTTMKEIVCFGNSGMGNTQVTTALKIIFMALGLPAIAASIAITCCICREHRMEREATRNTTPSATMVTPESAMISHDSLVIGLDQSTIESYTKVVLGESKRLPGHDDATCPICLSEYNVKEIVRCIPECKHCFHAECIDEWLKRKGTCPVCRNSPSPASVTL